MTSKIGEFKMMNEDELREEVQVDSEVLLHLIHRMCNERLTAKAVPHRVFPATAIQWNLDENGKALPYFTVQMENGTRIAVLVAPLPV